MLSCEFSTGLLQNSAQILRLAMARYAEGARR